MKIFFKQILKVSAFYLDKQGFIPKKNIFLAVVNIKTKKFFYSLNFRGGWRSRTAPWTTALLLLSISISLWVQKKRKKMNLKTIQMKQTFLAPIEAPCWLRPAKTASGVLGCIASIILTNKLFSKKIWCRNSVKPVWNKDICFLYWLNNLTVYWCVKSTISCFYL